MVGEPEAKELTSEGDMNWDYDQHEALLDDLNFPKECLPRRLYHPDYGDTSREEATCQTESSETFELQRKTTKGRISKAEGHLQSSDQRKSGTVLSLKSKALAWHLGHMGTRT
ncbi:unnamed protein product [Rhodiola kirilowii]